MALTLIILLIFIFGIPAIIPIGSIENFFDDPDKDSENKDSENKDIAVGLSNAASVDTLSSSKDEDYYFKSYIAPDKFIPRDPILLVPTKFRGLDKLKFLYNYAKKGATRRYLQGNRRFYVGYLFLERAVISTSHKYEPFSI